MCELWAGRVIRGRGGERARSKGGAFNVVLEGGLSAQEASKPRMARTFVVNGSRPGSGYHGVPRAPQHYCCDNIVAIVTILSLLQ